MNCIQRPMKRLTLLLILCLASCSREPAAPPPPPYDAGLRDGSVIFWQGGLLVKPILKHTDSDITHAAIVLYNGQEPFVYEAVPPRVHKVPLTEYRRLMEKKVRNARRPMTWFVIQPVDRYTLGQLAGMKAHAESQLGRPHLCSCQLSGTDFFWAAHRRLSQGTGRCSFSHRSMAA